jgi:hypothetical protein
MHVIDELARHGAPLLRFQNLMGFSGILRRLLGEMAPGGNGGIYALFKYK